VNPDYKKNTESKIISKKRQWNKPELSDLKHIHTTYEPYDGDDGTMGGYDS